MQNLINNRWIRWTLPPIMAVGFYSILIIMNYFRTEELSFLFIPVFVLMFYVLWELGKRTQERLHKRIYLANKPYLKLPLLFLVHLGIHLILLMPVFICFKYFFIKYKDPYESISMYHFVFAGIVISFMTTFIFALQRGLIYIDQLVAVTLEKDRIQKEKEIRILEAVKFGEERERNRIAKDLHDGIAGMLAASKIYFTTIQSKNTFLNGSKEFEHSLLLIDQAAKEIRKTAYNLVPETLLQYGLDEALRKLCQVPGSTKTEYYSINYKRLDSNFELFVYRIVQELLLYMTRFSKATHTMVQLSQQQNIFSVSIEDNGVGINFNAATTAYEMESIRNRVHTLNGNIEWEKSTEGTSVYVEFDVG